MAYITCGRCGVRLRVIRTGPDRVQTHWDSEAVAGCEEAKERLAKGEKSVPIGECSAAFEALKLALRLRRV